MKKLLKWIESYIVDYLKANPNKAIDIAVNLFEKNKDKFIKSANSKIDLPMVSEKKEAELLEALFEFVIEKLKEMKK